MSARDDYAAGGEAGYTGTVASTSGTKKKIGLYYPSRLADLSGNASQAYTLFRISTDPGDNGAYLREGDTAIKEIRTILAIRPNFLPAMANLSELLFLKGEKSESCQLAYEATKMGYAWIESEWDAAFLRSCPSVNQRLLK